MLRSELDEMRAMADEARKTNQLLYAYIDYILENQYQWQREAERLSSLLKKSFHKPNWSLFSKRKPARPNVGLPQPSLTLPSTCADLGAKDLRRNEQTPRTQNTKIVCHERFMHALRRLILLLVAAPVGERRNFNGGKP